MSLKDEFVKEITNGVVSGKFPINSRLPSERDLAEQFGCSRGVVRSGLAELAANGIIRQHDRHGCVVVDFRSEGRISIIDAILTNGGMMDDKLLSDFMDGRKILECHSAGAAAVNRTNDDLYQIYTLIKQGQELPPDDFAAQARQIFLFHRRVAIASGNTFYPIFLNSMEHTVLCMLRPSLEQEKCMNKILQLQDRLFAALHAKDPDRAFETMEEIIDIVNCKKAQAT